MPDNIKKIVEEFKGKLHKYDKDGGFIVYVEDYDNQDFDVDLIIDYFEKSLTQAKEEGRKEKETDLMEVYSWGEKRGRKEERKKLDLWVEILTLKLTTSDLRDILEAFEKAESTIT